MGLSIIIPTYRNVEFIPELVESILRNDFNEEYEVLVGIDSCYDTLHYIYENQFPSNFKFFFFENKKGPYIIKNTLTELSKFDKLLFFDSDDIMMSNMISEIHSNLDHYGMIKPKYINFTDQNNSREFKKEGSQFGEGVFGIRKELFLNMNGFEGWEVAADSDFMGRYYKTNNTVLHTQPILFHRRIHGNSLTVHPDTGLSSRIRGQYHLQSKRKTSKDIVNEFMIRSNYKIVDFQTKILADSNDNIDENYVTSEQEIKKRQQQSISNVLTNKPKIINFNKTPKTINYQVINSRTNQPISSQLGKALKKAKLEEIKKGRRKY